MCFNDVTARDIQIRDKQWVRGKTFDTFAPTGPVLVTTDEIPEPGNLNISLTLNGVLMQNSNTSNLIFGVEYLVRNLSEEITLEPGDIVTTGTPGGVGVWRKPPVFLKSGDEVSMTVEGLGTLTNRITKG
jgi:2-keto-4-pentenoate hydratase/2-oxohepta-3-ene-1,7-dioic acid hydratase in catechol pathway